jgi:hypothetical protein
MKTAREIDEHPLDAPLGTIHEAAIALSIFSRKMPWETALTVLAVQLAEAHEAIQRWVIANDEDR